MWTPKPAIELSSQRAVRRHNLSIVLRQVVERGPRSRATIAQDTGLNKSTVSTLVSELMEFGLLVERGAEHRGTAGRPGLVVDVARDGVVALGLEVNVDYLGVQATDLAGGSRYKAMEAADNRGRGVEEVLDALGALAEGALDEVQAQGLRPIGATVALPGLVDIQHGCAARRAEPALAGRPGRRAAAASASTRRTLPLGVDNEANLAALAELWEGAATGIQRLHVRLGRDRRRRRHRARRRAVPRLSRVRRRVRPHDGRARRAPVRVRQRMAAWRRARAWSRCWPPRASTATRARAARASRSPSSCGAPRSGDAVALAALADCGRWLGVALGTVVNLLSPQAIVLGGHFAPMTEWLAPVIASELSTARPRRQRRRAARACLRASGAEAAMRGAAATQLRRVLADPTLVGVA